MKNTNFIYYLLFILVLQVDNSNAQTLKYMTNSSFMKKVSDNIYETKNIIITENPKETYKLEIKNGKPFNGYEVLEEKLLGELPLVNYYINGELKNQYSVDYLAGDQFGTYKLNLKTSFNNNKIVDGYEYKMLNRNILKINIYNQSKLKSIFLDVFDMHYFNRISFIIKDNNLEISSKESSDKLEISKEAAYLHANYFSENKWIQKSKPSYTEVSESSPNSTTVFYLDANNNIKKFNLKVTPREMEQTNDNLLFELFMQFSFKFNGNISEFLSVIDEKIANIDQFNFSNIFESLIMPYNSKNLKGYLNYDENGKINSGNSIEKDEKGVYTNKTYDNGKLISQEEIKNIIEFYPSN